MIDINYYSVPQAEKSNLKHRPIGMGIMGFQDALYTQKIPYASEKAVEFADLSMEVISYHAISASAELAAERGRYESYDGSTGKSCTRCCHSARFTFAFLLTTILIN